MAKVTKINKLFFIGIDPGKTGGVSIIDENRKVRLSQEMPLTSDRDVDIQHLSYLINLSGELFCCVEKSQPMPKQGVRSVFSYGKHYGQIIGLLKLTDIPFQEIPPTKWKKEFSLDNKKYKSIMVAEQLFPGERFLTPRMRYMDGKAESLLLAEYARRIYNA